MKVMGWEWIWSEGSLLLLDAEDVKRAIITKQRDRRTLWRTAEAHGIAEPNYMAGIKSAVESLNLDKAFKATLLGGAIKHLAPIDELERRGRREMGRAK